ncbi:hypothetical protein LOD99_2212 [Oopsacas minuta]|uniref:Uncharacterized protein n=1 Tax=Oopsacas minuta TaxID=111878 RepID=A0AAV7K2H3_9METZ|nr:hypothetical protein LOD99_2212 [Oopsacas minuta]
MPGFLLGLQAGCTKHACFLCLWNGRADDQHYGKNDWPVREELFPGIHNVIHNALVKPEKVLLPPLHIKLGLVKQFIKSLNPDSDAFKHIRSMFPKVSEGKASNGIFVGPPIRRMLVCSEVETKVKVVEKRAWQAFRLVVSGFWEIESHKTMKNSLIT